MSKNMLNKILAAVVVLGIMFSFSTCAEAQVLAATQSDADGSSDGSSGADDTTDAADVDSYTVTRTTTTNVNGEETKTVETDTYSVGSASGTTDDLSDVIDGGTLDEVVITGSASKQKTEDDSSKEDDDEEDLSQYTGLYKDRQIMPDIMARHCKIKGEDVAKDVSLYVDCIKQYVSDMNNENATAKAEAEKEFEILRYKTLIDAASNAMTKSQSILNYEETMNKYNSAEQEMQTEFDDNHALIATMSFMIDVLNSFRELQAEQLKYMAISGIVDIDPAIVMEEEEKDDGKVVGSGSSGSSDYNSTSSTYKLEQ